MRGPRRRRRARRFLACRRFVGLGPQRSPGVGPDTAQTVLRLVVVSIERIGLAAAGITRRPPEYELVDIARRGVLSRRGLALFAAMSVIWGMPYLLIKIAVGGVPVSVLVLARVVIGAALLLPIALRRGEFAALRGVWRWVVLFAFVEIVFPWIVLSEAERSISSSLTGLLIASVPIIVALLGLLIGVSDRLSPA